VSSTGEYMSQPDPSALDGDLPIIEFVSPMPGFPDQRRFLLVRLADDAMVYTLTAVSDPGLRFLVVAPPPFFPEYAPEVDDETLELLDGHDPDRLLVLLVVTAGESVAEATANLLAPIIVDQDTRRAVQAVLTGTRFSVRTPLLAA
jgi:flagellar assembly factor FliW